MLTNRGFRIAYSSLAVAVLILVGSAALLMVDVSSGRDGAVIAPACASPAVTASENRLAGRSVGEVLLNGQVVFRIRTAAGGYSPVQRAQMVADRLALLMGDSLDPEDITTGRANDQYVVLAEGEVVITADPAHARLNQTTPVQLSELWAQRLANAVAGRPVAETPVAEKVVPIISVGTGTRVGGALVTGPGESLDRVTAVGQIEGTLGRSVRARALVPVSSEDVVREIRRVPQTSVIGLVDIRL